MEKRVSVRAAQLHEMKGRRNAMNSSFMQQAQNLLSRGSSRHSERQSQADDRRDSDAHHHWHLPPSSTDRE